MTENHSAVSTVKIEQTNAAVEKQTTGEKITLPKKRVIWITGSKGGTGKSTFARGLLDILLSDGIKAVAFDGDPDNAQLFRYYNNADVDVTRIPLKKRNGVDAIFDELEKAKASVILVDVPAGSGSVLVGLEDEGGFLSAISDCGYHLTVVSVLSRIKDSVNQLKLAMEITDGYDAAHVAVKNLYYGDADKFRFLARSKTKQRLLESGGTVVEMRDLFDDTYELVDDADLPFLAAVKTGSGLPSADVRRIKQWLLHFKRQVLSTEGVLGL